MLRGEIWWVEFDQTRHGEIQKTRPAIIVSNNAANSALNRVVVVPVTSKSEKIYPSETRVTVLGKQCKAMADQIVSADKSRLRSRIGELTPEELQGVETAILQHLGIRR